jgi:hypothetical protein
VDLRFWQLVDLSWVHSPCYDRDVHNVTIRNGACLATLVVLCGFSGGPASRDGSRDFDWDVGTWTTHQRRLLHPLTGSNTWVDYRGTDVVRKLWSGGLAATIEANGPAGHLHIFSVRLYDANAHQWEVYFTNPAEGTFGIPVVGAFHDGRADFYDQEPYGGRTIWVRFSVTGYTKNACRFEQAFSDDGGKSWEVNFVVTETRVHG